ncbi:ATP-binding cassette subfamily C protein LapB [Paucimonas lemoignei]|uniref:ATP-binding cassette subfamily C protein LapB n=1 Tax=Paucimonas lemoignei TaxID=29443 RepID=A0A4R3HTA4_PAULE|nr:ATP-binding cassette domain-containing protein [Paucimonas lemoignei]TCS36272.1 ATP-binding cassette subfamily C protein LapB [Paucimonas lemoignei]
MKELWRRISANPKVANEMYVASFLIAMLGLASSLYSTQVLNRYLSQGIDATLFTLTLGGLIALWFEVALRNARTRLAQWGCAKADRQLGEAAITACTKSQYGAVEQLPAQARREMLNGLSTIHQSFGTANVAALLDAPFALLFLLVLFMLSPALAVVALLVIGGVIVMSLVTQNMGREPTEEQSKLSIQLAGFHHTFASSTELVRAFQADELLKSGWGKTLGELQGARARLGHIQALVQNSSYAGGILMSMLVMGLGAREVFAGHLDVGSLIGANILAGRALSSLTRVMQMVEALGRGNRSLELLGQLARLPMERTEGTTLGHFAGKLSLEDLAFAYPKQPTPLFERLDFTIEAGSVIAVTGANGSGKTSFARMLAGLIEPGRGRILADGMDLRQALPEWWRRQIVYLPQDIQFFDGSLRENLTVLRPSAQDEEIIALCRELALGRYIDASPDGLGTVVRNQGQSIPPGIRRRLALVRALLGQGQLVILDDPSEAIDAEGCRALAAVLNRLVREKKTIIVMTNEPFIISAAQAVIDLNVKPTPRIVRAAAGKEAADSGVESAVAEVQHA